jgi:hypothetical protein
MSVRPALIDLPFQKASTETGGNARETLWLDSVGKIQEFQVTIKVDFKIEH